MFFTGRPAALTHSSVPRSDPTALPRTRHSRPSVRSDSRSAPGRAPTGPVPLRSPPAPRARGNGNAPVPDGQRNDTLTQPRERALSRARCAGEPVDSASAPESSRATAPARTRVRPRSGTALRTSRHRTLPGGGRSNAVTAAYEYGLGHCTSTVAHRARRHAACHTHRRIHLGSL